MAVAAASYVSWRRRCARPWRWLVVAASAATNSEKLFCDLSWVGRRMSRFGGKQKLHRWLLSVVAQRTVHIGDWIAQYYWDEPSLVLYGGVDAPVSYKQTQITNKGKSDQNSILGRLTKVKTLSQNIANYLSKCRRKTTDFPKLGWGRSHRRSSAKSWSMVTGMVDKPETYVAKADVVWAPISVFCSHDHLASRFWGLWQHQLKRDYLQSHCRTKKQCLWLTRQRRC